MSTVQQWGTERVDYLAAARVLEPVRVRRSMRSRAAQPARRASAAPPEAPCRQPGHLRIGLGLASKPSQGAPGKQAECLTLDRSTLAAAIRT